MTEFTTYEKIQHVQNELLIKAASGAAYDKWSNEFARKEIRNAFTDTKDAMRTPLGYQFTIEEIRGLSDDQLKNVGFRIWDGNHWLIPLYLMNYIKRGEQVLCISGHMCLIENADNDHRGGCIAYGFKQVH